MGYRDIVGLTDARMAPQVPGALPGRWSCLEGRRP